MLSILNDTYKFDASSQYFTNEIIYIYPGNRPNNLCNIITAELKEKCFTNAIWCSICNLLIPSNTIILCNDVLFIHVKCRQIIDKIINNDSIATIKISINDKIIFLPVYYYIKNVALTCNGIFIERWTIRADLPTYCKNIYTALSLQYDIKTTFHCSRCFDNTICRYTIMSHEICHKCAVPIINFKNALITKFMYLDTIVVRDINIRIIREIIDIYASII